MVPPDLVSFSLKIEDISPFMGSVIPCFALLVTSVLDFVAKLVNK